MFKEKEEIIVVAVLAIIISALLAGYGVYYVFGKQPTEAIEPQLSQTSSGAESDLLLTITPVLKIKEEKTADNNELQDSQEVLENFFSYLANGQYEEASALYSWEKNSDLGNNLQTWPGATNAETLKNYCEALGTCLEVKVLTGVKTENNTYRFIVQFIEDNGEIFRHPFYPGAAKMTADFSFGVEKINGQFKVVDPPLYFP